MCENLTLTVLEKRALDKGLATQRVRLKAGRIVWDEITKDLSPLTGDEMVDADKLLAFKKEVARRPYYHEQALKEWLNAQIESGYADVLESDVAQGKQIDDYKRYLEAISG